MVAVQVGTVGTEGTVKIGGPILSARGLGKCFLSAHTELRLCTSGHQEWKGMGSSHARLPEVPLVQGFNLLSVSKPQLETVTASRYS